MTWVRCRTKNSALSAPWYIVNLDHVIAATRDPNPGAGWWLRDVSGDDHVVLAEDAGIMDELIRP